MKSPHRAKLDLARFRVMRHFPGQVRREHRALMDRSASSLWWGRGRLIRHIALDLFSPVSLCLRPLKDVSSSPEPTPIGVACPTCKRLRRAAVRRVDEARP